MESAEYLAVIRDRSAALLAVGRSNLGAAVPSCPGWTMEELITHVGGVWGWAARVVESGLRADSPESGALVADQIVGWAEEQAGALTEALVVADPTSDCWT
ncbi:MAG TPA: maleylpyruvate isomerase N-terminal domain-containing protein, partial [Acidimicrobiales bacterium]|nr:maleylpyruvate isomerase N-terminal domain-containing protein [Acidimicrobiales bacterium]